MTIMEARVKFRFDGRLIESHELDYTAPFHAEALIHARDRVGFANVSDEDQSKIPLEVYLDFVEVPLTTVNDFGDTFQLRGLDDMTVVDYSDAMKEADYRLIEAVENDPDLLKAVGDCSLGQLFLIIQEIKTNIDNRNGKA